MSRTLSEAELMQIMADELFTTYRPNGVIIFRWGALEGTLTPVVVRALPGEREAWPVVGQSVGAGTRPDLLITIQRQQGAIRPVRPESDFDLRESMTMPVIYGGHVEAVIEVIHTGALPGLAQSDLDLLRDILTAAAGALQTIRLYELQRSTAEHLAEVDRI